MDELFPIIMDMLQDSSSLAKRQVSRPDPRAVLSAEPCQVATLISDFPPGGAVDSWPASSQHRICGGALPQVPLPPGGAAQLPEDGAEPGHPERGVHVFPLPSPNPSS